MTTQSTKLCPGCTTTKPVADFGSNPSKADGLQTYCRACQAAKRANWADRNRETIRQKDRDRRAALRAAAAAPPAPMVWPSRWEEYRYLTEQIFGEPGQMVRAVWEGCDIAAQEDMLEQLRRGLAGKTQPPAPVLEDVQLAPTAILLFDEARRPGLIDLMNEIRGREPTWSDAKLAVEAKVEWQRRHKVAQWSRSDASGRVVDVSVTVPAAEGKPLDRVEPFSSFDERRAAFGKPRLVEIHRPIDGGLVELAVDAIVPSRTNPRKIFDPAFIEELADSIAQQGLAQPILVRPLPHDRIAETSEILRKGAQRPTHEIIAGEQRWRACRLAGIKRIPTLVRVLADADVLQLQLVENLKRRDLHPMEEAEGYERLRSVIGLTADQIADRIGKKRSYVYKTIKLLDLVPEAREAFHAGKLTRSTAELVAMRQPDLQPQLLKDLVATDFYDEPMSFREAKAHIENNYMLRLTKAPFDTADPLLVPAAGSCGTCPKRTGASPQLFDDVQHSDSCTDPTCFATKKEAHYTVIKVAAEARGQTVLVGREALEVMPNAHTMRGYTKVDEAGGMKSLRDVLGDKLPATTLIEDPRSHELVEALPSAVVGKLLKDQGLAKSDLKDESPEAARIRLLGKFESRWRTRAIEAAFEQTERRLVGISADVLRLLALMLLEGLTKEERLHVCKLLKIGTVAEKEGIAAQIRDSSSEDSALESLLLLLFMQHDMRGGCIGHDGKATPSDRIAAVASMVDVDAQAIQAEIKSDMKAEASDKRVDAAAAVGQASKPGRKPKTSAVDAAAAIAAQLQAIEAGNG